MIAVVDAGGEVTELLENNNRAHLFFENTAPFVVVIASVTSGSAPLSVQFDASGSLDPDGDSLSFAWVFGDGSSGAEGEQVTHVFSETGQFPVTVVVTDERGATASAGVVVTVSGGSGRECRVPGACLN